MPVGKTVKCLLAFIVLSVQLHAQSCLKSAKPLWLEIFDNSNALPGKTPYVYDASVCPQAGNYTVVDSSVGCFGRTIHQNGPGSHFMFFNSAANPSTVYTDTVRNLCSSSINLRLTVVIMYASSSVSCSRHPVVPYFSITITTLAGQSLAKYYTGNLFDTGLVVYTIPFNNVPGNSSAIIKIDNLSSAGCGNAFLLCNMDVAACGPEASIEFANPAHQFIQVCPSDSSTILLKGQLDKGYDIPAYQWQTYNGNTWVDIPGVNTLDYPLKRPLIAGAYLYRLTASDATNIANEGCRVASDALKLVASNRDPVTIRSNSPVCENAVLNLVATGGTSFKWSGPDGFTSTRQYPDVITNKNSGGQYKVIVTAGAGCTDTATTTVNLLPSPAISVSDTQRICNGNSVSLHASGGTTYSWFPIAYLSDPTLSNPVARPPANMLYNVAVTDTNHCTSKADVVVVVGYKPVANAGNDKATIQGSAVTLDGTIQDSTNVSYSWLPVAGLSNANVLTPVTNPNTTTTYTLTATSLAGCGVVQDSVTVTVYNGLYIPNAFSPNGDGLNDVWRVAALAAYPQAKLAVYNRYGKKIFESTGGQTSWNGTYKGLPQPTGAYPFVIDLKNNTPAIKGMVVIVR